MGINLGGNGVDESSMKKARMEREIKNSPPEYEPGMGDGMKDPFDSDDLFGSSDSSKGSKGGDSLFGGSNDPFGSSSSDSLFGSSNNDFFGSNSGSSNDPFSTGPSWGSTNPMLGGSIEPPKEDKSTEDKIFSALGSTAKQTGNVLKDLTISFKTFGIEERTSFGHSSMISGGIVAVVGLLFMLLSFGGSLGLGMLVGGLISLATGLIVFWLSYGKLMEEGFEDKTPNADDFFSNQQKEPELDMFSNSFNKSDMESQNSFDMFKDDFKQSDDEDDFEWEEDYEDDEGDDNIAYNLNNAVADQQKMDTVLDKIESDGVSKVVTRAYLFDTIMSILPNITPDYNELRIVDEDSDEFDRWDAIVQNSSQILSTRDDAELLTLETLKESLFYYSLEITREKWLKNVDSLVKEIVNICQYNPDTGVIDEDVYGTGHTVGDKIMIKVMKGTNAFISLKDLYSVNETEVKSVKNKMPIILGVDEQGNSSLVDFYKITTMLVSGMPRSGKTWFILNIISQLAIFNKPSELQMTIIDPKGAISDFKQIELPHIKKFHTDLEKSMREIRHIVEKEGPRRKKIIGDAGYVKIEDYNEANPDNKIPYLYVIVDEVMTIANTFESENKGEFNKMLGILVSNLPAAGIRLFMIPHLIKDGIIKKDVSQLIPFRVSVKGDQQHIEQSTGDRNFKYKLNNEGDMAVRMDTTAPVKFVHAGVLAGSNEELKKIFDFISKMWLKLEPESYEGSIIQQNDLRRENEANRKGTRNVLSDSDVDNLLNERTNEGYRESDTLKPLIMQDEDEDITEEEGRLILEDMPEVSKAYDNQTNSGYERTNEGYNSTLKKEKLDEKDIQSLLGTIKPSNVENEPNNLKQANQSKKETDIDDIWEGL